MKRIFYISIGLLFVIASACKKDQPDIDNPEPAKEKPKQCRIISGPNLLNGGILNFLYNPDSSINNIKVHDDVIQYYYEGGKLKAVVLDDGYAMPIDSFETDQTGKVIGKQTYGMYDDDEPYTVNLYSVTYLYNSQDKIVQANYKIPKYSYGPTPYSVINGRYYYTYDEKGNVIKEIDSMQYENEPVKLRYTALYEYDNMKNPYHLMSLFSFSLNLSSVMSPNNITRKHEFYENGKEQVITSSYSYSSEGYPNEIKLYYSQTNDRVRHQYNYECR